MLSAQANVHLVVNENLMDLVQLGDANFTMYYCVTKEQPADTTCSIKVLSSQKINQVAYCEATGLLNDLIKLLQIQGEAVHLWLDLDHQGQLTFNQINDIKRPLATNRINVYAYIGTKEQGRAAIEVKKESVEYDLSLAPHMMSDDSAMKADKHLIEKVENTDVRFLMPDQMPTYLRIDKDIREGLVNLAKHVKEYSQFDVLQLDREMTRKLELELDRHGAEFKGHRKGISTKLKEAVKLLEESILLKDEIISIRLEKQQDTIETYDLCKSFQKREAQDSIKLE